MQKAIGPKLYKDPSILQGTSGCASFNSFEIPLDASPMISRDFKQALLSTSSAISLSIPTDAQYFARKSISSRM
jgi:hypothetical protein